MALRRRDDLIRNYGPALQGTVLQVFEKTITLAQMQALFTTPVQITDAPGADKVLVPKFCVMEKSASTAFTLGTATDLAISPGATGAIQFATTPVGFMDQATQQSRVVFPKLTAAGAVLTEFSPITGAINLRNTPYFLRQLVANMTVGTGAVVRVHLYAYVIPVNLTFSW